MRETGLEFGERQRLGLVDGGGVDVPIVSTELISTDAARVSGRGRQAVSREPRARRPTRPTVRPGREGLGIDVQIPLDDRVHRDLARRFLDSGADDNLRAITDGAQELRDQIEQHFPSTDVLLKVRDALGRFASRHLRSRTAMPSR